VLPNIVALHKKLKRDIPTICEGGIAFAYFPNWLQYNCAYTVIL